MPRVELDNRLWGRIADLAYDWDVCITAAIQRLVEEQSQQKQAPALSAVATNQAADEPQGTVQVTDGYKPLREKIVTLTKHGMNPVEIAEMLHNRITIGYIRSVRREYGLLAPKRTGENQR